MFAASAVNSPKDLWVDSTNALWGELFNYDHLNGQAGNLVKAKICRLLYKDVLEMNRFQISKRARTLGFCLNVMGLLRSKEDYFNDSRALHKAILIWTKKNFARLYDYDQRVAEACLVDGTPSSPRTTELLGVPPLAGETRAALCVRASIRTPLWPITHPRQRSSDEGESS